MTSNWCDYEADQAIIKSLELESVKNSVIPLLYEDCKIPDKLRHLNYVDLTNNEQFLQQMRRLKKALLPDASIGTR